MLELDPVVLATAREELGFVPDDAIEVVLGDAAPGWLADRRLPARLVDLDGAVITTAGWPERRAA